MSFFLMLYQTHVVTGLGAELSSKLPQKLVKSVEVMADSSMILFDYFLVHVVRLCRIFSQPSGHAILFGIYACGRKRVVSAVAKMLCYRVFKFSLSKLNYSSEWKDELRKLLHVAVVENTKTVVLIDESFPENRFHDIESLVLQNCITTVLRKKEIEAGTISPTVPLLFSYNRFFHLL